MCSNFIEHAAHAATNEVEDLTSADEEAFPADAVPATMSQHVEFAKPSGVPLDKRMSDITSLVEKTQKIKTECTRGKKKMPAVTDAAPLTATRTSKCSSCNGGKKKMPAVTDAAPLTATRTSKRSSSYNTISTMSMIYVQSTLIYVERKLIKNAWYIYLDYVCKITRLIDTVTCQHIKQSHCWVCSHCYQVPSHIATKSFIYWHFLLASLAILLKIWGQKQCRNHFNKNKKRFHKSTFHHQSLNLNKIFKKVKKVFYDKVPPEENLLPVCAVNCQLLK